MYQTWLLFAILSPALYAVNNLVDKHFLSNLSANSRAYLFIILSCQFVYSGILAAIHPLSFSRSQVLVGPLVGFLLYLGLWTYLSALAQEQASTVVSITLLCPVAVAILASYLLQEILMTRQYLGIALLVFGATLVTWRNTLRTDRRSISNAISLLLLFSVVAILEKWALGSSDYYSFYFLTNAGAMLSASFSLCLNPVRNSLVNLLHQMKTRGAIPVVALNESANCMAQLCLFVALAQGPVTAVNAISSFQLVFVIIYAVALGLFLPQFREAVNKKGLLQKILGAFTMLFGAYLLA